MNDMHVDHALKQQVRDALEQGAPMLPPNHLLHTFEFNARRTRRLPHWLAVIKEPPMRTDSRVAVGSPIARVMVIMVATLLLAAALAAAGIAGQRLLAANGPIVVAADGSGHFTTISDAVAAADDGDEILVEPGIYPEVVTIDKDITLRGHGSREEVVLEFGTDGPTLPSWSGPVPYGLMLVDTEATISDLTVRGPNAAMAIVLVGGEPTLERVDTDLEGQFAGQAQLSVVPLHGAGATIRDSLLDGPVWPGDAGSIPEYEGITGSGRWIAEDNVGDSGFWVEVTDGSSFLRNTFTEGGFELGGSGSVLVAENVADWIDLDEQTDGYTIRDNVLRSEGSDKPAITLGNGASVVEDNVVSGAPVGILVPAGGTATIAGNEFEGLGAGIVALGVGTDVVIEGNRFCGNDRDLGVPERSSLTLDPSNEICESAVSE